MLFDDIKSELDIPSDRGCVQGCMYKFLVSLGQLAFLGLVFGLICLTAWGAVKVSLISATWGVVFAILSFVAIFAADQSMKMRLLNILSIIIFEVIACIALLLKRAELIGGAGAYVGIALVFLILLKVRGFLDSGDSYPEPAHSRDRRSSLREETIREIEQDRAWNEQQEKEGIRQQELADYHQAQAEWVAKSWKQDD